MLIEIIQIGVPTVCLIIIISLIGDVACTCNTLDRTSREMEESFIRTTLKAERKHDEALNAILKMEYSLRDKDTYELMRALLVMNNAIRYDVENAKKTAETKTNEEAHE